MAINFPNNPAVNDTFTVGGTTFTFTGLKWESSAVVELSSDTTPSLGGDLDGGAKNINNVGVITATGLDINGDADISGNLSVQGTTTTIDTAVTSVDSLQIDGTVAIGTATGETNFLTTINGDLSLGEKSGADNTYIDQKQDGSLEIINSGRTSNNGSVRINRHNNISGDTTYFRDFVVYDGKGTALLTVDGSSGNLGIGTDNPARVLHTSGNLVRFDNDGPGAVILVDHSNNKNFRIVTNTSNSHSFTIEDMGASVSGGGTARLSIDGSGTLYSYSPDDTTPNFKFRSNDTNWHGALNQSVHGGTITSFLSCGGDWDANGTTYNCTKNVAAYPSSAIAVHNQYNSSFESKFVFLKKAGGSTTTDGSVTELASISSSGVISDSIGPLRRLGINAHNAATYTLVASDAGKLIREATNGANITIPQNVFAAGDMISIFNISGGDNTITQGSGTTLYNTADGATGNRTLAAKGVCTIVCTSTNEFIISGSGLS